MSNLNYTIVREGENTNITVYKVPEFDTPYSADSTHARWEEILAGVLADDLEVLNLFNIADVLQREIVSERVQVAAGRLYFDGDEVDDSLAQFVVRMISEGDPQYPAFVNFLEKVYSNPQEHSRSHLFDYVRQYDISITPDGDLIVYKGVGVNHDGEFKTQKPYLSGTAGPANVSGYEHKQGYVPQAVGDVVSMPRTVTWTDPTVACSTGLHVTSWDSSWIRNYAIKLVVLVNPRDVVSVPHDDDKIRCCRYKIVGVADEPYTDSVVNGLTVPPIPEFDPELADAPQVTDQADAAAESEPQQLAATNPRKGLSEAPVFTLSAPAPKVKHPSKAEFQTAKIKAKAQRKGLRNYIGKRWTLIDGDGSKRQHWSKG